MIHAYDKMYLEKARASLARMFDFAVYDLHYDISVFFKMFLESGLAARFEKGETAILVGKSGVELAYEVLEKMGEKNVREEIKPRFSYNRSEEYWAGWALAYYQWKTALSFSEIVRYIPIEKIVEMYTPYHEMDIRQFTDKMDELYQTARPDTNLKMLRKRAGLSQRELAEQSEIPLRTIQQYEQRQKNINKASAEYVIALSKVLICEPEELLERVEN